MIYTINSYVQKIIHEYIYIYTYFNETSLKEARTFIHRSNPLKAMMWMTPFGKEKIRQSPPGMVLKPCKSWDKRINYQPQLVQDFWTINSSSIKFSTFQELWRVYPDLMWCFLRFPFLMVLRGDSWTCEYFDDLCMFFFSRAKKTEVKSGRAWNKKAGVSSGESCEQWQVHRGYLLRIRISFHSVIYRDYFIRIPEPEPTRISWFMSCQGWRLPISPGLVN